MRLALLTALWGRPDVSRIVLGYYGRLPFAVRLAVGSEGAASRTIAEEAGFEYLEHPNEPLSDKWNAGALHLKRWDADAVVVVGSDDLITRRYFERLPALLKSGATFAYLEEVHYYEARTGRMAREMVPYVGAGRMLSRGLMDRLRWQPWERGLSRYLDRSMGRRMLQVESGRTWRQVSGEVCVDVKTEGNLWSIEERIRAGGKVYEETADAVMHRHFGSEYEQLLRLRHGEGAERKEAA